MRPRDFLPQRGWGLLTLLGLGAGASVAWAVSPAEGIAENALSTGPQCRMALSMPVEAEMAKAITNYEIGEPPLWDNLGTLAYDVSTSSAEAQAYFNQGLRQAANFNHAEARRAFRMAQKLDPNCAMCFAGEALVLGPNINAPMDPAANQPAVKAIRRAEALAGNGTNKEKRLIEAISARYADPPPEDRTALNAAFADAVGQLSDEHPDDLILAAIAAEAAMDTQPWDYWQPGGHEPKGRGADIQRRLESVLAQDPNHPWAMHLYIHFVEASDRPERGEPYADKLAALMPGAGHIVHMPSHIYFRIGRYEDALSTNEAASKVDEDYIAETGAAGVYPIAYYSHNIHFALVSAALIGDRATVMTQADKLDEWLTTDVATDVPFVQPLKAAPYFAWAQYGEPDMILALAEPPGAPPYVKAMWHYARGTAFAAKKDSASARKEAESIRRISEDTDWSVMTLWGIPAVPVLDVAAEVVFARAAQAEDDEEGAIASFRKAADAQDTIPYMEPPYWYHPVRQSLGAALVMAGQPEAAQEEFAAALDRERNSAWVLYGIKEAAKATGDRKAEQNAADALSRVWKGDPASLTLSRM
jgi:tetratricopeptide (TPR) repeat protein